MSQACWQRGEPIKRIEQVNGTVRFSPQRAEVKDLTARAHGHTRQGRGRVQADALLSTWTPLRGLIQGALDSNIDFSGRGQQPEDFKRTLTLVGLAAFTEGTIGPGPTLDARSPCRSGVGRAH